MTEGRKPRLVGINHVAIEVGDIVGTATPETGALVLNRTEAEHPSRWRAMSEMPVSIRPLGKL